MTKIFEEIFNEKEREAINRWVEVGEYYSIPSALESLGGFEMTKEKEHALQVFLDDKRPIALDDESAVRQELEAWERKGNKIETKEQQVEWQAKFDAEKASKVAQFKKTTEEKTVKAETTQAQAPVETKQVFENDNWADVEMTRNELKEELTKRGVTFKPTASKPELVALLEETSKSVVA